MKLLYLTFQEDAPLYLGVKNKIEGQVEAFEKLGYTVTFSLWGGGCFRFFGAEPADFPIRPGGGVMKQLAASAEDYLRAHPVDVLYFRLDRVRFDALRICALARAGGAKTVVIEIPNYPYLGDYVRNIRYAKGWKTKLVTAAKVAATVANDRLSGLSLRKYADAAVLYGNRADTFFGIRAMNGENGVNVDAIQKIPPRTGAENEISILGVAGTLWWQGYDRILEGMSAYQKNRAPGMPAVKFVLVGGDATEMPAFRAQAESLGLADSVTYCGFKKGRELAEIYRTVDLGASSLGCYRRGLTRCSSLKAREYCAAALPFIYAYEDESLDRVEGDFALKLPNDSSPVDIVKVVDFVRKCRGDPSVSDRERRFAEQTYDWKTILKQVLDFAVPTQNSDR